MAKLLDQIIVVDIESTCWEGSPPEGQDNEIIEIGLCMFDVENRTRLEKQSIIVKPIHSEVSSFCTELTTLTPEMISHGISFKEACKKLKKEFIAPKRLWASYGDYDRRQFERQCKAEKVGYPFSPTHLNVKNLFALWKKLPYEVGMAEALEILELPLEGVHHRGIDDAWNIALILQKILPT